MNLIVFHIVSGHSFFSGTLLLIGASFFSLTSKSLAQRVAGFSFVVGLMLVVVSSTAIPYWLYGLAFLTTLFWIGCWSRNAARPISTILFCTIWLLAALCEAPYHVLPRIPFLPERSVTIIGDSVSAGTGGNEDGKTWPKLLARQHDLIVQDISHVGETATSAFERAQKQNILSAIVIVEIGGNDILGTSSVRQFSEGLDRLLALVTSPDRVTLMFELPLPPLCHEYGRIQRQLAKKYNVLLIPKRVFLSVIADDRSTLDSVHLSISGHQKMADIVWKILRIGFEK